MAHKEIDAKALGLEITEYLSEKATKPGGKREKPGVNLIHGIGCVLVWSYVALWP